MMMLPLTLLGSAKNLLMGKARLIIEYFLIAFVVALAGVVFTMWLQKKQADKNLENIQEKVTALSTEVVALEIVNTTQNKTIDNLRELRGNDAKALDGLINDYKTLAQSSTTFRKRLTNLENTNAQVRALLIEPLPIELKCLLNKTCKASDSTDNRESNPAENTTPILRPSNRY